MVFYSFFDISQRQRKHDEMIIYRFV